MKKLTLVSLTLLLCFGLSAVSLDLGFSYGSRSISDSDFKTVFGSGGVFAPELSVTLFKGFFIGALLESGYEKDGQIGTSEMIDSTLKVTGFEAFVGYTLDLNSFHPFVRIGFGSYSYTQSYDFPAGYPEDVRDDLSKFEESKGVVTFSGGLKVDLAAGLYLGGQIRYVPMKVTPIDKEIDLSGLRAMVTLGYRFDFDK